MKIRIKLPDVVIDVPDKCVASEEEARNLGEDYGKFIKRFLLGVSWKRFCKDKYPWLTEKATLSEGKSKEADNWRQLKPGSGEALSDLLRKMAERVDNLIKKEAH